MKSKQLLAELVLGLGLVLSSWGANATLIDNGTYTTDTAFGLDWLDLSATDGQSVTAALSSNGGWAYANNIQVSNLLSSFGITYLFTPSTVTPLSHSLAQATNFQNLFGVTLSGGAIGGYFNAVVGRSTSLCISTTGCGAGGAFTNDYNLSSGDPESGQFLVRSSTSVPEPATLTLLGLGLAGLGFARRKKQQA